MTNYTSMEQLPITLSANQLAQVLGISRANVILLIPREDTTNLRH